MQQSAETARPVRLVFAIFSCGSCPLSRRHDSHETSDMVAQGGLRRVVIYWRLSPFVQQSQLNTPSDDGRPRGGLSTAYGATVMYFDDEICRIAVNVANEVITTVDNYNRLVKAMPNVALGPYGPLTTVEFAMRELRFTIKDRGFDLSRGGPGGGIAVQEAAGWGGFPVAFLLGPAHQ